tara:strand:+ start:51 stop:653 length:603 start_codon:yes stop_codon:yes gene_type:complete
MKVLELFSGTGSVGKVCKERGYDVLSLDIDGKADITCDILEWKYELYDKNSFDIIWSSPDCTQYSKAKSRGVRDIEGANKLVQKTLDIINYFKPKYWYIENPQTGLLKKQPFMMDLPFIDADYCMYGKPYRKRTRFWTNVKDVELNLCNKKCGSFIDGRHIGSCGTGGKGQGHKKSYSNKTYTRDEKYSIPSELLNILIQ